MDQFSLFEVAALDARAPAGLPFTYYARKAGMHDPSSPAALHSAIPPPASLYGHDSPVDADWDAQAQRLVAALESSGDLADDAAAAGGANGLTFRGLVPESVLAELDADGFVSAFDLAAMQNGNGDAANGHANGEQYTSEWLLGRCEAHLVFMAQLGDPVPMDAGALSDMIEGVLKQPQRNDAMSASLFELLGSDNMDLIEELVRHREDIIRTISAERKQAKKSQLDDWKRAREEQLLRGPAAMPTGGIVPRGPNVNDYPGVFRTGDAAARERLSVGVSLFGNQFALPEGTLRHNEKDYEEIVIPASRQAAPLPDASVITVNKMPAWTHCVYKGYKSLNKVQSLVHPIAFETNENMLVCAPTGAGKTDVAMLTVLRTISNYLIDDEGVAESSAAETSGSESDTDSAVVSELEDGEEDIRYLGADTTADDDEPGHPRRRPTPGTVASGKARAANGPTNGSRPRIAKKDFKIIYVAPMKALAAEVVDKFSKRLGPLGIQVRELTGDMQLTKQEILATQMIVTTPEKWDVITRKATGDSELSMKVKLLIIDEVHLLNEERGTVLETIVARTQRQVETSQSLIRIVGLSATLPNFVDVAQFLRVNPHRGLFYFDSGFRPVPLTQHIVGIKGKTNSGSQRAALARTCYEMAKEQLKEGHQVMVFVHSRKDTYRAAQSMREQATQDGELDLFDCTGSPDHSTWSMQVGKSRSAQVKELFTMGFGMHHAGMLRPDRTLTERLFAAGVIKVLFCTATLAWGVNLPAHAVIIRGTDVYDAQRGSFVDLGILDVLQIFGRAGRPQYESEGVGYILTPYEKMAKYVSAMTHQLPIESQFASSLVDNLNAEITLGTVANVDEAVQWLGYTYMYVRMRKNPVRYGITADDDPALIDRRRKLVEEAARVLLVNNMIVYDANTGALASKEIGRIASTYYIKHPTVELINEKLRTGMGEADVLVLLSECHEFKQIKLRDEETKELDKLLKAACPCQIRGNKVADTPTKVNVLLQAYVSHARIEDFALISDTMYIAQNAGRILRAMFEFAINRAFVDTANAVLGMCKSVERRMWGYVHPLSQFPVLPFEMIDKLTNLDHTDVADLREMSVQDVGELVRNQKLASVVIDCAWQLPWLEMTTRIAPITSTVVELHLDVECDFSWLDAVHGNLQVFWMWIEDPSGEVLHTEQLMIQKSKHRDPLVMSCKLAIASPPPNQLYIHWVSDTWIGCESVITVTLDHLILPDLYTPHTDLLPLNPLPVSALKNPVLEEICGKKFQFFNPIQTQVFHTLYNSRENVLLGAPTGSGKTVAAELAMWSSFRDFPDGKVVYIAPLKALVRERVDDWKVKLAPLGAKIVELTGDVAPDIETIHRGNLIITTPEKWDGISRGWRARSYVQSVRCVIIDEIHLLGGDRGPILEIIVSRMHYIAETTKQPIRIVGLSTALANARDLADWLGIKPTGMFNFKPAVRPVQIETYIDGFAGKHYCPRMATMNRPCYAAILRHSPTKPALIFVSSRRQTRLTALDIISYCCLDDQPKRFLHMSDDELEDYLARIKDPNLAHTLSFGIGMHHAGLADSDRRIVEELFVSLKIQVLVATSTLAWGVNTPAHLVCIKGTEFYDAKKKKYVDFDITDVLQMMGRAGRPGYDDKGVACVFVEASKKNFYKKFLHSPFPVESSLHRFLHDHLNAEIATGTIKSKQDALDYVTWTYFFRRLQKNPTYYGLEGTSPEEVSKYLSGMVDEVLGDLDRAGCMDLDGVKVTPQRMGEIGSYYYMFYQTLDHFNGSIRAGPGVANPRKLLDILALAQEYAELPVRHNEDLQNRQLAQDVPFNVTHFPGWDNPHLKAHLLLQAHISRATLPIVDYVTDTLSVLDQSVRVLQAMLDVAVYKGLSETCLQVLHLLQSVKQAQWISDPNLNQLPAGTRSAVPRKVRCIAELMACSENQLKASPKLLRFAANLPLVQVAMREVQAKPAAAAAANGEGEEGADVPAAVEAAVKKLQVTLHRRSAFPAHRTNKDTRIHAPRFPKTQYEGWYVMVVGPPSPRDQQQLGEEEGEDGELAAKRRENPVRAVELRRFQFRERDRMSVTVSHLGAGSKLYLMCDGYQGLDQEFDLE
ncbi:putative steryl acetyl hydrolase mug81 [Blastocladiella emersonii ATCC 22665]|nr:putative steryl acetyl hydrolase mug81 [Blastocladiella emersonii ATCC 22665]